MPTVRVLEPDDWTVLRDARLAALTDAPERFSEAPEDAASRDEASWRESLRLSRWLVVEAERAVVGLAEVWPAGKPDDADAWIGGWWTSPAWRRRGVARRLLAGVDAVCRVEGWLRQGLGVWCENADGRAVFERLGFAEVGGEQMSQRFPGRCYVQMLRTIEADDEGV